jgi:hypothetical protein
MFLLLTEGIPRLFVVVYPQCHLNLVIFCWVILGSTPIMLSLVVIGRLTKFNPSNAHVCGLLRHGALVGSGELDGDQTKAEEHEVLPRFGPLGRVMTYVLLV